MFEQFDHDTIIITPNRRLAATLHKIYDAQQEGDCWIKPSILPLSIWLEELWQQITSSHFNSYPLLLNPIQEDYLWESILSSSKESHQLIQINDVIELVKSAHHLLCKWLIDINQPIFTTTPDYQAFQQWVKRFAECCKVNNWIVAAQLPNHLFELIEQHQEYLPKKILLAGFTELEPQYASLWQRLTTVGIRVDQLNLIHAEDKIYRLELTDEETEILTIARWAKNLHDQNKEATIACVFPNLASNRDFIQQTFATVFATSHSFNVDLLANPFNISAGKNLLQYPIIQAALQLMALYKNDISIENLSYILASPFVGDAENEQIKRAKYDRLLRKKNVSFVNLRNLLSSDHPLSLTDKCPALSKRLKQFFNYIDQFNQPQSYVEWSQVISELLSILGWPGERSINSEEYQVVTNWLKMIEHFVSLDFIAKPIYFTQAVQSLQNITLKQSFQAKTSHVPIQILGLLEAAGTPFDNVWVAGIDDITWPPSPNPNPFIPKKLQRELNMPHATAMRELQYCKDLLRQFKQASPNLIFSYAKIKTNLEVNISPLVKNIAELPVDNLSLIDFQAPSEKIFVTREIEFINDETGPGYNPQESADGGINIIKQQAICPFKAFAECRLHANELHTPQVGLRKIDRGIILHKTLELVWNKLNDHMNLLLLNAESIDEYLELYIDEALKAYDHLNQHQYYLQLEKKRLKKLILRWLEIEKLRPPFKVIAKEYTASINLKAMNISIRIDRIDELADGSKLVIDYKTTDKDLSIENWFGDRPDEPQLPLYTLLETNNITGISFAQIHPEKIQFKGVSNDDLNIAGIKSISKIKHRAELNWHAQLTHWRATFYQLSTDFYSGVATVNPKDQAKSCLHCSLKPFCRIEEELFHA